MDRSDASWSPAFLAVRAELQTGGEDIAADDPAALSVQLQERIIKAVTAEPAEFDRPQYERLMQLWKGLEAEDENA